MKAYRIALFCVLSVFLGVIPSKASQDTHPDWETLADAIYQAEDSQAHPYGIMVKYKTTTPRQACINTCKHKWLDWLEAGKPGSYMEYLASKYAPIGASNDPTGLNKNWLPNVRYYYAKFEAQYANA